MVRLYLDQGTKGTRRVLTISFIFFLSGESKPVHLGVQQAKVQHRLTAWQSACTRCGNTVLPDEECGRPTPGKNTPDFLVSMFEHGKRAAGLDRKRSSTPMNIRNWRVKLEYFVVYFTDISLHGPSASGSDEEAFFII